MEVQIKEKLVEVDVTLKLDKEEVEILSKALGCYSRILQRPYEVIPYRQGKWELLHEQLLAILQTK